MSRIKIKKGLDLPIAGKPQQKITQGNDISRVALLGEDYIGMRPTMEVEEGDRVKLGQLLFTDKKNAGVQYTSPGSGRAVEINRGAKRKFLSLVIELEGNEEETFTAYSKDNLKELDRQKTQTQLVKSGLWTLFKTRPFSKVPALESTPHAIFVTAMDSNPLAPDMPVILEEETEYFSAGLYVIQSLTNGKSYICKRPDASIPVPSDLERTEVHAFDGPHPAGLAGTHIHFLDPVSRRKTVWSIAAQDVVAIGHLFLTGRILVDRIISLAGPGVKNPRLIKTRIGADINELTKGELVSGTHRLISGSVLDGRQAVDARAFLGRFHQQVSVIPGVVERQFLGWLSPGFDLYSIKNIVLSKVFPGKKFAFTPSIHGGKRAIVPVGTYEQVVPMDILPTYLYRALAVDDVEESENLGCLELEEADLALSTFACPAKIDHGENLRRVLTIIEKEG
jgi:Na+-transporting NADH:ubiquinone oxidoreductase subunit A